MANYLNDYTDSLLGSPTREKGRARDKAAAKVGMSGRIASATGRLLSCVWHSTECRSTSSCPIAARSRSCRNSMPKLHSPPCDHINGGGVCSSRHEARHAGEEAADETG
jgi:hypothetical protein